MKEHVFRLHHKDDIKLSIADYCDKNNIKSGCVVCGVGCVLEVGLRKADGVSIYHDINNYEITALMGSISANGAHLHISLCDNDLKTIGGHLVEGCLVNTTCEVVLLELESYELTRAFDATSGYDELLVKKL